MLPPSLMGLYVLLLAGILKMIYDWKLVSFSKKFSYFWISFKPKCPLWFSLHEMNHKLKCVQLKLTPVIANHRYEEDDNIYDEANKGSFPLKNN